jgi:hypothetical protein
MASFDEITNPISSFFYPGRGANEPLSYQSLVMRRKIAEALMGKRSPYPKNIGEGLAAMGEAIGERRLMDSLTADEREQEAIDKESGKKAAEAAYPTATAPAEGGYRAPGAAQRPPSEPDTVMRAAPSLSPPTQSRPNLSETSLEPVTVTPALSPDVNRYGQPNRPPPARPPAAGPQSQLIPAIRDQLALADLTRQGVVPPDPMIAQAPPPGPISAASTITDDDNPLTAMAQTPYANPITLTDIQKASRPPAPGPFASPPASEPPPVIGPEAPQITLRKPVPPPLTLPKPGEREAFANMMGSRNPEAQRQWGAVLERLKAERVASDARNTDQYKADVSAYEKALLESQKAGIEQQSPKTRAEVAVKQEELAKAQRAREDETRFGSLGRAGAIDALKDSHKATVATSGALDAISSLKNTLADGTFTGPLSTPSLYLAKARELAGGAPDKRVANTEDFRANVAQLYGELRPLVAGTGTQSDRDLAALQLAAGGGTTLNKESILKILNRLEGNAVNRVIAHQRLHATVTEGSPGDQRMLGSYGLPVERILPKSYIDKFKEEYRDKGPRAVKELEDTFHTPGLALRLFEAGRLDD